MSTQQSGPSSAASRFSTNFIRDLPIWTKLGLIMIVPTIATIIVGTAGLLDQVERASDAERARSLTVLSGDAGVLVHALQYERTTAVKLLFSGDDTREAASADYAARAEATDRAVARYGQTLATVTDAPANLRGLLDDLQGQIGQLPPLRAQVSAIDQVTLSAALNRYRVLVEDLLRIRDVASQLTGDAVLTDRVRAAAAVAQAKEFMAQEWVVVLESLATDTFSTAAREHYAATRQGATQAESAFRASATADQIDLYERTLTGAALRTVLHLEGSLDSLRPDQSPRTIVDAAGWEQAMVGRAELVNQVEVQLNAQAQQAAVELGAQVQRRVLVETGILLLTLLVGVLFAWLVARSMARSLRDLRQGALAVAQFGLPQAVARLRDPTLASNSSPAGVALQIAEPLPVRSNDEFGQVTEAFNAVHLEAVRTAAEQAALRASVATMFVNLARRSQILVDRLIGHLDRLERGEQDPDRLSELFQLDHLATRMRRNDENLLVLAGADSTRIQREPAALMDVLRAAQSEVEQYTRVEFLIVDHDIEIAAHAVNDLVHLVAELFDNATAFSPPDTPIRVEAQRVGERAVLRVEDRGIGMSAEQYMELNERLAAPPQVDVAVSRMMGLVVVARLAGRHGVKVELQPAGQRGTVAEVVLPSGVLVPRALAGRTHAPAGFPAVRPDQAPDGSRSPFGPPLALESGSPAPTPAGAAGWDDGRGGGVGQMPGMPPGQVAPAYGAPAPGYGSPAPAPSYGSPAPGYGSPAPAPDYPPMTMPAYSAPVGSAPPPPPPSQPSPAPAFGAAAAGVAGAGLGAALTSAGAIPPVTLPGQGNGRGKVPAWYDLTGAAGPTHGPATSPGGQEPLPQRRPGWGEGEGDAPDGPVGWAESGPGGGYGQPGYGAPAPAAAPLPQPGGSPWSAPGSQGGYGAPPATGRPPAWPPAGGDGASAGPGSPNDMTMELPIFSELESAWFASSSASAAPTGAPETPRPSAWPPEGANGGGTAGADGVGRGGDGVSWRTAADDGWRAAAAASSPQDAGTTDLGLPRRVPMAQLVPGGMEMESAVGATTDRRTPDSVRGLLSAYTRGVQRGREAHGNADDSYFSGKEQEA